MKPTLQGMDKKSANVAVVMQPPLTEPQRSEKSKKRLMIGIVSGIILVLIIVAAVLTAVFLGAKVTKDAQTEAWLNYQDKNGDKKSEQVVATDREEDYTVPNQLRIIYDFEKNYAVYKMERSDGDSDDNMDYNVCYVTHLNRTNLPTPTEVKDAMTDTEIEVPSNSKTEEVHYESTGQRFDRNQLSPRAQEMCKDSKVVWMAKRKDEPRERRSRDYPHKYCYYPWSPSSWYHHCVWISCHHC